MKKNFIIALVLIVISFLGIVGAIVLEILEKMEYCSYVGMAATVVAFFSIMFGLNSWKEK